MRGATLFSGIGAPEAACPEIDWRWQAEIDPFACAVLRHRFPHIVNLGDVNRIDPDATEPVDIVVFGSPCQDFSVAGKRKGMDGERGNLSLVALALVARLRPRWLVFENVPGLLSNWSGEPPGDLAEGEEREGEQYSDFAAFLGAVRECGYLGCWRVFDAQFAGVPQRRRRVFFVGYLGDWRPAAAVLFESESLRGDPVPRRETGQDAPAGAGDGSAFSVRPNHHAAAWRGDGADNFVADPITSSFAKHGGAAAGKDSLPHNLVAAFGGNRQSGPIDVATAVNARGGPHGRLDFESETFVVAPLMARSSRGSAQGLSPGFTTDGHVVATTVRARDGARGVDSDCTDTLIAHSRRADGFDAGEDGTGRGTPLTVALRGREGGGTAELGDDVALALRASQGGGDKPHVLAYGTGSDAVDRSGEGASGAPGDRSGLNITEGVQPSLRARPNNSAAAAMTVRRLTPAECEKLQGFWPGYTAIPYRGKPAADGPRYRAIGNSMAVPVIGWILKRILTFNQGAPPHDRTASRTFGPTDDVSADPG